MTSVRTGSWLTRLSDRVRTQETGPDDRVPLAEATDGEEHVLARAGIFQGVSPTAVSAVTKHLRRTEFPSGRTIFTQGDPSD
ncbi:MAG: family transcriptional regulator, cyclic receptor protein, partial [Mycobacterium sp.]|nr:family transcriptional regulator, cyclic receptor protein [Mycobacterium sp.]